MTLTGCLQALAASFLPHFRDNLWNRLLCQSNLRWQPRARVHTRTHKRAGLPAWDPAWWSWILSRISNLDWLGSAQTLPSLQGHLCCEEKKRRWRKRDRSERSPIGWLSSLGEWNKGDILISSCQKPRLWKDCFCFFPILIILFLQEVPSGILSLINLCETKVGLEPEKTKGSLSTLEPGPHECPICRLLWGYFKEIYIYCFWCCKESHFCIISTGLFYSLDNSTKSLFSHFEVADIVKNVCTNEICLVLSLNPTCFKPNKQGPVRKEYLSSLWCRQEKSTVFFRCINKPSQQRDVSPKETSVCALSFSLEPSPVLTALNQIFRIDVAQKINAVFFFLSLQ